MTPATCDIVLIGGGHSHVDVLKSFGMRPQPGVRLTLIARDVHTPYSGMLPGWIAGHYGFDETHVDLRPLCRFADVRLYRDEAIGICHETRTVQCRNRPPVPFDLLSLNIGSTPNLSSAKGAAERVTPVKPIGMFMERWQGLFDRVLAREGPVRIGGVGTGVGGVEIMLSVERRLRRDFRDAGRSSENVSFELFGTDDFVLPQQNASVRRRFMRILADRGIRTHLGSPVVAVEDGALHRADGSMHEIEEILWTTEASAAEWLGEETALTLDDAGFIQIHDTLESVSHPGIFAAGDISSTAAHPRPKAGVFAVRQGPPLGENLRRAAAGQPLKPFHPQKHFLTLISTGEQYAIGSRGPFAVEGKWVWTLKDWIDRRWMNRYGDLPEMTTQPEPKGPPAATTLAATPQESDDMRCGGCGAKISGAMLERTLSRLKTELAITRPDIIIGLDTPDDAAAVAPPAGRTMLHSIDFFRALVEDPYLFGRIAANHALSDIYAMGGEPQTALAVVTVPHGPDDKVEDTLFQLMAGSARVLTDADCALVGGHSGEGAEVGLGFSINGSVDPERMLRKSGLRAGDHLILTKPLGTGTLMAADMRAKAKGRWIDGALQVMTISNRDSVRILLAHGADACTDVTGFGLLGHLLEMLEASGVGAEIDLAAMPVLDGALETAAAGLLSSLHPENARNKDALSLKDGAPAENARMTLLFDPQTAGGLLAGIPEDMVESCIAALIEAGLQEAAIIGRVVPRSETGPPVAIR